MNTNSSDTCAQQPEAQGTSGGQLRPLLLLTSIFFVNFLSRIILAPMMPRVESDLGISHAEGGSFFLLISTGYFITLIARSRIVGLVMTLFGGVGDRSFRF